MHARYARAAARSRRAAASCRGHTAGAAKGDAVCDGLRGLALVRRSPAPPEWALKTLEGNATAGKLLAIAGSGLAAAALAPPPHGPSRWLWPAPAACAGVPPVHSYAEGHDFTVFRRPSGGLAGPDRRLQAEKATLADLCGFISGQVATDPAPDAGGESNTPNVVLLGEVHDDVVTHWLQLDILKHCYAVCKAQGRRLVLSLEMFESDVQQVLDEYVIQRAIREQDFLQDARPWANYGRDYRPLVEFCREHGVSVVAANMPRRYVSLVSRGGCNALQSLLSTESQKAPLQNLPPLPLPAASAAYRQKFYELIASQVPDSDAECPFIGFRASDICGVKPEILEAQQLWDHSMAMSIARARRSVGAEEGGPGPLVVHVCGAAHCAHGLGIPEALPLYPAGLPAPPRPAEARAGPQEPAAAPLPWLPIDDEPLPPPRRGPSGSSSLGSQGGREADPVGPKPSPPGVVAVVCWPASVDATLAAVQAGSALPSLATMGEWVIITEETRSDEPAPHGSRG